MGANGWIWQTARVRADARGRRWLVFSDPAGCARCREGNGCGAAQFSRLFTRPGHRIPLPPGVEAREGDRVGVGVRARWLVAAAAAVYLSPVAAFVTSAVLSDAVWPGRDGYALALGLAAALAALAAVRRLAPRWFEPDLVVRGAGADLESGPSCNQVGEMADGR